MIKDRESRTSDYVCNECGRKFLNELQKQQNRVLTYHIDRCGICQQEKEVTHIRAFSCLYNID